jgi:hypothetical protein
MIKASLVLLVHLPQEVLFLQIAQCTDGLEHFFACPVVWRFRLELAGVERVHRVHLAQTVHAHTFARIFTDHVRVRHLSKYFCLVAWLRFGEWF